MTILCRNTVTRAHESHTGKANPTANELTMKSDNSCEEMSLGSGNQQVQLAPQELQAMEPSERTCAHSHTQNSESGTW